MKTICKSINKREDLFVRRWSGDNKQHFTVLRICQSNQLILVPDLPTITTNHTLFNGHGVALLNNLIGSQAGAGPDHIKTTTPDRATTIKRHLNNTNDCLYRIRNCYFVAKSEDPSQIIKCAGIGGRALDIEIYWPTLRKQPRMETELCQSILNKCQPACLRPLHILDSCIECRQVQFIVVSLAYDTMIHCVDGWLANLMANKGVEIQYSFFTI